MAGVPDCGPRTVAGDAAPPSAVRVISTRLAVPRRESPSALAQRLKHQPRRFPATEARQFLDAARSDGLHALYELALRTGLRKGKLLGLLWEDLDLTFGTASVRRSLQRTRTGGLTRLPTKPGRLSAVSRSRPNGCAPSRSTNTSRTRRGTAGSAWRESGLVFATPTGQPLDPVNLTRRSRSFLDLAALRRIRFQDLRHSTATLLLEQGSTLS
ncbi:hypothetical protein BSL84_27165 [Streptomyces sp. TN58]|nr:hypothetical protein BSL84_27165 [Streptomyces sp. TN58]